MRHEHHSDGCSPKADQVCQKCLGELLDEARERGVVEGKMLAWKMTTRYAAEEMAALGTPREPEPGEFG